MRCTFTLLPSFTEISHAAATKLLNAFICARPRWMPCGAGLSQPIFFATASSTARLRGSPAMFLRRNASAILAGGVRQLVHEATR